MLEVILKRFEKPDEVRNFEKGKFEVVHIGGMTIGRATYEPGWRWSEHVGPSLGKKSCGACRPGRFGASNRCHRRRHIDRDEAWRHFLCPSRPSWP
jgi:hypothetical protein